MLNGIGRISSLEESQFRERELNDALMRVDQLDES